ncbi:hypothetical protein ACJ41O_014955 [Fusarium nematophilum]
MEVFGIVAAVASLAAFSSSSLVLVREFAKDTRTIERLDREIVILRHILKESSAMISHVQSLPKSIEDCLKICIERQAELLRTLDFLMRPTKHEWAQRVRISFEMTMKQPDLMLVYNSFRDSVLLLRDLSSTLRMDQHFLQMGMAIAQILSENEGEDWDDGEGGANEACLREQTGTAPAISASASPTKRRRRVSFFSELKDLFANDFTRSLVLVIHVAGMDGAKKLQFVPVRNAIDTKSDENLVSAELLAKHGMDQEMLTAIPEEHRQERELGMIEGFKFTPTHQVRLSWHKHNDMKQREDLFVVVNQAPFDVLIGLKQWKDEFTRASSL